MKNYIIYDANGTILRTGGCPGDSYDRQARPGENILQGQADDQTQYILDDKITNKPSINAIPDKTTIQSGGTDYATITGIPNPAMLAIEGKTYTVTDGTAQVSFNAPGTYTVTLSALNHLDQSLQVTAS